jgi:uncharacterized protein YcaQ
LKKGNCVTRSPAKPRSNPINKARVISRQQARQIWIAAQRLDENAPFGSGAEAVKQAIAHLGYVQIDTINVIERCHHHILFNRIPAYARSDLHEALSDRKSIFEYWTHALSFLPVEAFPYFVADMKAHRKDPGRFHTASDPKGLRKILKRIRDEGPLAISDIKDDVLVEKAHLWASKKPSKRALETAFYNGQVAISKRQGMLKTYELTERHFGWERLPKPSSATATIAYLLDRTLKAQGVVSLDSICYLNARHKPAVRKLIGTRLRKKELVPVIIEGAETIEHWAQPEMLEASAFDRPPLTHILSPFDPLIIQRARTSALFDYDHLFEAYVPPAKRKMGYFTLPVLHADEIIAALDLKADRTEQSLLIQAWHWVGNGNEKEHQAIVENALDRFAAFQFAPHDQPANANGALSDAVRRNF